VKTSFRLALVAATCLLTAHLRAADGLVLVEKAMVAGNTVTNRVQMTKDRMRTEMAGGPGEKQAVLFDATKQVLWLINLDKKTYMELTKAEAERLGAEMSANMAQMQEQFKNLGNLPPDQRARVEAMMKGRDGMPGMAPLQKIEYRRAGTDKVGKWACAKYEGFRGAEKAAELCTVEPQELGVAAADFDVARQAGEFFKRMNPQNADRIPVIGSAADGFTGYPVRRVTTVGTAQMTSELVDASRQNIPDSAFELPAGFKKEAFPGLGR
jgi:Domain of unknown function (DUF4412)